MRQRRLPNSAAYRSMFEYLRRVKIPALMQQSVFLDAYAADMQVDLERLAELEIDGSGVIDTDELANRIVSLQRVNDELSRWISSNGEQNPRCVQLRNPGDARQPRLRCPLSAAAR